MREGSMVMTNGSKRARFQWRPALMRIDTDDRSKGLTNSEEWIDLEVKSSTVGKVAGKRTRYTVRSVDEIVQRYEARGFTIKVEENRMTDYRQKFFQDQVAIAQKELRAAKRKLANYTGERWASSYHDTLVADVARKEQAVETAMKRLAKFVAAQKLGK